VSLESDMTQWKKVWNPWQTESNLHMSHNHSAGAIVEVGN
jgi:hypothetical protein